MKVITCFLIVFCCGVALAVQYCTLCANDYCVNNFPCAKQDLDNATGCVSFWIDYGGINVTYAGCWEPSLGTCEQIIEAEKQIGYDAVCSICYEDNCNSMID